jgi:hypothetical protein
MGFYGDSNRPFGSHVLINRPTTLCGLTADPITSASLGCGRHEILSKMHRHLTEWALTPPVY